MAEQLSCKCGGRAFDVRITADRQIIRLYCLKCSEKIHVEIDGRVKK